MFYWASGLLGIIYTVTISDAWERNTCSSQTIVFVIHQNYLSWHWDFLLRFILWKYQRENSGWSAGWGLVKVTGKSLTLALTSVPSSLGQAVINSAYKYREGITYFQICKCVCTVFFIFFFPGWIGSSSKLKHYGTVSLNKEYSLFTGCTLTEFECN